MLGKVMGRKQFLSLIENMGRCCHPDRYVTLISEQLVKVDTILDQIAARGKRWPAAKPLLPRHDEFTWLLSEASIYILQPVKQELPD